MKRGGAHEGSSNWHRRDRTKIGPVVSAVRIGAVVVTAVPLQIGDATVIPGHHAAPLVLGFDSGTILFSPARRGTRQRIDCCVCWDMSIGSWSVVCRLFGNGRLVLVGGLFCALDSRKDGHIGESDRRFSKSRNECSCGTRLARWAFGIEKWQNISIPVDGIPYVPRRK